MPGPDLYDPVEVGPCIVCGLPECRTDHATFDGKVKPILGPIFVPTENVYRDGRLKYAVNEPIPLEVAVAEGLTTPPGPPEPEPTKGKRGTARAKRPDQNRSKQPLTDDRSPE